MSDHINKYAEQDSLDDILVLSVDGSDIYEVAKVLSNGGEEDVSY